MHEANRLKSEFLANMSHELRTPLNAIIGFADLMFKGKVGPVSGDHKEYLGDILNSSRHLLKLINDVLDLAKVESGKMEFHPEAVDLGSVIAEVCDILRGLASTRRIRIETSVDPSIAAAVLDPSKLKQVLYNYLSNALKFSPEAGLVNISVFPEGQDGVRLEVEDRGIGIRPEDVHRLFVEFQQLDAGMAKRYAGTGLGLALTRRIIEAQGGATGVRSEPGRGSTFWAVLPRTAVGDRVTSISQAVPTTPVAIVPRTVLVVDDDPAALRLMGAMLKAAGHTGICFTDAKEALHALETMTPAAAVIDLSMPGMDGFALLNAFRALPAMHAVPVLVWTVQDLGAMERERLLVRAARIVLKGQGDSEAIIDALLPYLGVPLRGTPMPGEPILIVDDNVVNLKLARILLQGEGYDVRTAVTAEDALNLLSTFAPRLVLTDIQLPGMDGLELTRRLKADVATRDVVVLALTAYAMKGDEEKALAAGCDGYVTKPIDISGLPKVIAEHLMVLQGPH
jgi:CheY-like chemotaxis protein